MPDLLRCHFPGCPAQMRYAGRGKRARFCPEHTALRKLGQNGNWRKRHKPKYHVTNHTAHSHKVTLYRVISDPDGDDGYPVGAYLRCVEKSLAAGVFTPGTVLGKKGRRYVVEGASGATQRLKEKSR